MQISLFPMQISWGETSWLPGGAAAWNSQRSRVHDTRTCERASTLADGFWRGCIWSGVYQYGLAGTYLIWYSIWCAGSTCAQERGCTDGGYLVCTEAQKSTRKRTRAHRQGAAEKMLSAASDRNGMSLSWNKTWKNSYIRNSASKSTLNHQLKIL